MTKQAIIELKIYYTPVYLVCPWIKDICLHAFIFPVTGNSQYSPAFVEIIHQMYLLVESVESHCRYSPVVSMRLSVPHIQVVVNGFTSMKPPQIYLLVYTIINNVSKQRPSHRLYWSYNLLLLLQYDMLNATLFNEFRSTDYFMR